MKRITLLLAVVFSASAALADGRRPLIQVGAGVEGSRSGGANVLLRIDAAGVMPTQEQGSWVDFYVARFRGDIAGSVDGVPYFDIEFIPVGGGMIGADPNDQLMGEMGIAVNFAPAHANRNVRMGRDLTLNINAIGLSVRGPFGGNPGQTVIPYVKVAIEALGYKLAKFAAEGADTFHGLSIFQGGLEVGLAGGNSNRSFRVLAAIGVEGGVAVGNQGTLLDGRVYAEARAEIRHFVELFVRGSRMSSDQADSGDDVSDLQLIGGVGFIF